MGLRGPRTYGGLGIKTPSPLRGPRRLPWGCVRTRDRIAKPRWRWVRIGHAKRTSEFYTWEMRLKKVIPKKNQSATWGVIRVRSHRKHTKQNIPLAGLSWKFRLSVPLMNTPNNQPRGRRAASRRLAGFCWCEGLKRWVGWGRDGGRGGCPPPHPPLVGLANLPIPLRAVGGKRELPPCVSGFLRRGCSVINTSHGNRSYQSHRVRRQRASRRQAVRHCAGRSIGSSCGSCDKHSWSPKRPERTGPAA